MKKFEDFRCFNGVQQVWEHQSETLSCTMNFGIYLPDEIQTKKLPVLYYLSGLTCTEQNVITKAGFQRYANEYNVIVVTPDTSPRGENVANDEAYDLGQGAGFYLNATQLPWKKHFKMYDYIVDELPRIIENNFNASTKKSIMGHSMGGHGALIIALRNADKYSSVSAFSPIVCPSIVPWGQKAFSHYLGDDKKTWLQYDAVKLIENGNKVNHMLVDQGLADNFYGNQLKTELLTHVCKEKGIDATIRLQEGYDHSYYFISTFIGDHIKYHAEKLAYSNAP